MRNLGRGVIVGVVLATACGGGAKNAGDSTAAAAGSQPAPAAGASATGTAGGAAAGAAAAQPATGKTWEVKMVGDGASYKYDPATLTIKQGDAVKWTVVSGPPHNVSFWPDSVPKGAADVLTKNMPNQLAPLQGPLLVEPDAVYEVSFAGAPKGDYHIYCLPHLALGMRGKVTVK